MNSEIRKYVAVIEAFAVRNAQSCMTHNNAPKSNDWIDADGAEIYIGIFTGNDEEQIRMEAALHANTIPNNVRLIDVNSDA